MYARDEVADLSGRLCEAVLKEESRLVSNGHVTHVFLHFKVQSGQWHRVFAYDSILFWYQTDECLYKPDPQDDYFTHEIFDLGAEYPNLLNQTIEVIELGRTTTYNEVNIIFSGGAALHICQTRLASSGYKLEIVVERGA